MPPDFDDSGSVDPNDLVQLIGGMIEGSSDYDITGDNNCNYEDLLFFSVKWGILVPTPTALQVE